MTAADIYLETMKACARGCWEMPALVQEQKPERARDKPQVIDFMAARNRILATRAKSHA